MNQYGLFEDAIRKECIVTPADLFFKKGVSACDFGGSF
jgi:hypothetical protein